jgi:hypothetical protein
LFSIVGRGGGAPHSNAGSLARRFLRRTTTTATTHTAETTTARTITMMITVPAPADSPPLKLPLALVSMVPGTPWLDAAVVVVVVANVAVEGWDESGTTTADGGIVGTPVGAGDGSAVDDSGKPALLVSSTSSVPASFGSMSIDGALDGVLLGADDGDPVGTAEGEGAVVGSGEGDGAVVCSSTNNDGAVDGSADADGATDGSADGAADGADDGDADGAADGDADGLAVGDAVVVTDVTEVVVEVVVHPAHVNAHAN